MTMRIMLTTAAMLLAAPAGAQDSQVPPGTPAKEAEPSVAGYLCTFAGKCDGADAATAVPTRDAPATKGFRLARSAAATGPAATAPSSARPANLVRSPHAVAHAQRPADIAGTTRLANRASLSTVLANPPVPMGAGRPHANLLIGFERNSATLSQPGVASARVFAQSLLTPDLSGSRFVIEGHTDARGSRALNMSLSARRAQAVADFLVSQGVDRSRLSARGLGPDAPLAGHRPADPDNRRVEAALAS
ncbi:MAG: OmpA family protein [Janthinobacterium lividum]